MLTLLPKGAQTKLLKLFCLKIFPFATSVCTLSREYLRKFSKKFEMAVIVYSDTWGKLIREKNQKSKISWHLEPRISPRIFEKIRNGRNSILRCLGETDSWKNQKSKISWHCPFKGPWSSDIWWHECVNKGEVYSIKKIRQRAALAAI